MGNYMPTQHNLNNLSFNYLQRGADWVEGANLLEQSPIDIVPDDAVPENDKMRMEYYLTDHDLMGLQVDDTGNTLQVNGGFSKIVATDVDGNVYEYEAVQFHFHAPSEHTMNGEYYDLELHIVHQITPRCSKKGNVKRNLAVVALFFDLDENPKAPPNPFIEALRLHEVGKNLTLNMHELLKNHVTTLSDFYSYKGSLTVPPCSDNANWYVIEKPLLINEEQLEQFDLRWKDNPDYAGGFGNNRPVQPLNGRTVMKSHHCLVMSRSEESVRHFVTHEKVRSSSPLASRLDLDSLDFERKASLGPSDEHLHIIKEKPEESEQGQPENQQDEENNEDKNEEIDSNDTNTVAELKRAAFKRRITRQGSLLDVMLSKEDVPDNKEKH